MTDTLTQPSPKRIRVLVVDDSALARKIIAEGLAKDPQIQVIGVARDPYIAREIMQKEKPDVITLDVEMPNMDGVTFLRQYMAVQPTPTIMVSALTEQGKKITIEALEAGAVDVVAKPKLGVADEFPRMMQDLRQRVKAAARASVQRYARHTSGKLPAIEILNQTSLQETTDQVIAIGASTGGVEGLARIIPTFPAASPGIVIVQHMPAGFTTSFAQRLNTLSQMQVKEADHGDRVRTGLILLAPGGSRHIEVHRSGGEYRVLLIEPAAHSLHVPSVDVLFHSVARHVGRNAAAVLMTGMGRDGADGLLAIRQAGGRTFAQNESSSVVYGMPKAAWELGAAEKQVSLEQIPRILLQAIGQPS